MSDRRSINVCPDRFYTLREAATLLNIRYWLLVQATNRGVIPFYTLVNGRRRVLLGDIVAAMKRHQPQPDES
jgi:hypothetical protein